MEEPTLQQVIEQHLSEAQVQVELAPIKVPDLDPPASFFFDDLLQRFREPLDKWDEQSDVVRFETKDNQVVRTNKNYFRKSLLLREFFQQRKVEPKNVLHLCTLESGPLLNVLEWCERHTDSFDVDTTYGSLVTGRDADPGYYLEGVSDADREYIDNLGDVDTLVDTLMAADFFRFDDLTRLLSRAMADRLKGLTAEQIRSTLRLPYDLRSADEDDIRMMNEWTTPSKQHFDVTF